MLGRLWLQRSVYIVDSDGRRADFELSRFGTARRRRATSRFWIWMEPRGVSLRIDLLIYCTDGFLAFSILTGKTNSTKNLLNESRRRRRGRTRREIKGAGGALKSLVKFCTNASLSLSSNSIFMRVTSSSEGFLSRERSSIFSSLLWVRNETPPSSIPSSVAVPSPSRKHPPSTFPLSLSPSLLYILDSLLSSLVALLVSSSRGSPFPRSIYRSNKRGSGQREREREVVLKTCVNREVVLW